MIRPSCAQLPLLPSQGHRQHNPGQGPSVSAEDKSTGALPLTHANRRTNTNQYGRGQAIRWEVTLQMRRQLQGQRTYFFPAGAFLIGYEWGDEE